MNSDQDGQRPMNIFFPWLHLVQESKEQVAIVDLGKVWAHVDPEPHNLGFRVILEPQKPMQAYAVTNSA